MFMLWFLASSLAMLRVLLLVHSRGVVGFSLVCGSIICCIFSVMLGWVCLVVFRPPPFLRHRVFCIFSGWLISLVPFVIVTLDTPDRVLICVISAVSDGFCFGG